MVSNALPTFVYYDNYFRACDQLPGSSASTCNLRAQERSLGVYVDGACFGNGTSTAQATWGIYFGPDSYLNRCSMLSPDVPHTSTRAEIQALAQAIGHILSLAVADPKTIDVAWVLTDSMFLVDSMNCYIYEWVKNGGYKSNGQPVAYYHEIMLLHIIVVGARDHYGVNIRVRHVGREDNMDADYLANLAFNNRKPKSKHVFEDWVALPGREVRIELPKTGSTVVCLGYDPGLRMAAESLFPASPRF